MKQLKEHERSFMFLKIPNRVERKQMKSLKGATVIEIEGIVAIKKGKTILINSDDYKNKIEKLSNTELTFFSEKNKVSKIMSYTIEDFKSVLNEVIKNENIEIKQRLEKTIRTKITITIKEKLRNDFCEFSSFIENATEYYLDENKDINLLRDYDEII